MQAARHPALVIDHSTGYMMHGGLTGALGRMYEHLACGSIRRCGFPFYGVSGDVCRWLQTLRHPGGWPPAELLWTPFGWTGWPMQKMP